MRLNKFFNRNEFTCRCGCGFNTVDAELLHVLTSVRKHFNAAVSLSSGCRCETYNRNEGGGTNSQHLLGRAADITVYGVSPHEVYQWLDWKYATKYGLGRYKGFTHIDTRSTRARW